MRYVKHLGVRSAARRERVPAPTWSRLLPRPPPRAPGGAPFQPVLRRVMSLTSHAVQILLKRYAVGVGKLLQGPNGNGAALLDAPQLTFREARHLGLLKPAFLSQCGDSSSILAAVSASQTLRFPAPDWIHHALDSIEVEMDVSRWPPHEAAVFCDLEIPPFRRGNLL